MMLTVLLVMLMMSFVTGSYDCVCNIAIQKAPVFVKPDTQLNPEGYLYEFDCKPFYSEGSLSAGYYTIQYEHKVVYIQKQKSTHRLICPGDPSSSDLVSGPVIPPSAVPSTAIAPTPVHRTATLPTTHSDTVCLSCNMVVKPRDCDTIIRCGPGESCYSEAVITTLGYIRYNLGCHQCRSPSLVGRRSGNTDTIINTECCNTRLCNNAAFGLAENRGQFPNRCFSCGFYATTRVVHMTVWQACYCYPTGYPPRNSRGPICYDCHEQAGQNDCNRIRMCDRSQKCRYSSKINSFTSDRLYTTSCSESSSCPKQSLPGFLCDSCCDQDLCNHACNAATAQQTASQPAAMTSVPIAIDHCLSNPCVHGTCDTSMQGFTCTCEYGYTGTTCDTEKCIPFQGGCYYFGIHVRMNFGEATLYCQQKHGAYLVTIETGEENQFLLSTIGRIGLSKRVYYWVGFSDQAAEGWFRWEHTGANLTFTDWHPGEPNNLLGTEDCGDLGPNYNYQWNDSPCDKDMAPICEKR